MEVLELNTALIEAYRDLDGTTRAAKDLAPRIKTTQQRAKSTTELWQAAELRLASLEQQLQQQRPLSLPATINEALPTASPKPSLSASTPSDGDPAHHRVATAETSTMTDSVQTIEATSPHPQTSHAPTQIETPLVKATTDTSPKADKAPTLQTNHDSTPPLPPPVVMEQFAQTDTTSPPRTT